MTTKDELACVYAALILADDDVAITGDKISTIIKASGYDVEPYWPGLFAKALEGVKVKDLVTNLGSVGAGAAAAPAAAAPAAGGKKEEAKKDDKPAKKVEPESEEEEELGLSLFD